MRKEDEFIEKEKRKKIRLVESIDSPFLRQKSCSLKLLSISMYPAATIMYMQSLPRPEPNCVSKSWADYESLHRHQWEPLPIAKKEKTPKNQSFSL